MAEIKTIIQLRNDTTENWSTEAGQATKLVPGEVAIEITEDGKAKMKIGTKDNETFAEAQYFGSDPAKVFQSEDLVYDNTESDEEVIARLVADTELNNGDCAIIKRQVSDGSGSYIYTSYVYTDGVWAAMDGNYDANNVYFKNDIVLAGSYEQVGNISKTKTETKTLEAAGKSLADVMQTIFTKEINTKLKSSDPGASISSFTEYIEIGSSTTKSTTVSLSSDGAYAYGYSTNPTEPTAGQTVSAVKNDGTTGVVVDTSKTNPYSVVFNGETKESSNATFSITTPVKKAKAELSAIGKVYYTQGGVPVSNLKKAYPAQRIAASQATSGASSVFRWYVPYYKGFIYGVNNKLDTVDVSKLTKITGETAYTASKPKSDAATASWVQYWLVVPKSYNWTMTETKDSNNLTLSVDTKDNIKITYGTGDNAVEVEYNVYVISHAADYDTKNISWK